MIKFNLKNETIVGGRRLIPHHLTISDYLFILKHNTKCLWYKYIGKYKIVDSTKYIKKPLEYFSLSEKEIKEMESYSKENGGVFKISFIPNCIAYGVEVEFKNGATKNITDYSTW